ncbi:hypothetical protein LJR220_004309 [Bradyrhizobium sp. LjRoot220]|uniref:hypothetical protein n=1 Tax=Bradyrhizobium sp. LjRoot220 TaxID=3342284 RepID=UPI003ECE6827
MTVLSEDEVEKRCVAAAVALSIAHLLTLIGTEYQVYTRDRYQSLFLVNYAVFLSPFAILFAARKACKVLAVLAMPILMFFVWRMFHVWEYFWSGVNSMAQQKGDALGFLTMIFDMVAFAIAGLILLAILLVKLIEGLQRLWRA